MEKYYIRKPIQVINGIPVFSDINDEYIKNYEKIASDHVSAIKKGIDNPFINKDDWEEMEESTLQLVLKYLKTFPESQKIKILDVGVGLGRLIEKIKLSVKDIQIEFYGVDISLNCLTIAREKGINVALAKIEDLPYQENYFDIVICTDVLEHVIDLNSSINKMLGCLKQEGYLIVRVPNKENLEYYTGKDCPYYYVHLRTFDRYSLVLLMEKVFGLETAEITKGLVRPYPDHLRYSLPPKIFWNYFIKGSLKVIKFFSVIIYIKVLNYFYEPIEINGVFKKCQRS